MNDHVIVILKLDDFFNIYVNCSNNFINCSMKNLPKICVPHEKSFLVRMSVCLYLDPKEFRWKGLLKFNPLKFKNLKVVNI